MGSIVSWMVLLQSSCPPRTSEVTLFGSTIFADIISYVYLRLSWFKWVLTQWLVREIWAQIQERAQYEGEGKHWSDVSSQRSPELTTGARCWERLEEPSFRGFRENVAFWHLDFRLLVPRAKRVNFYCLSCPVLALYHGSPKLPFLRCAGCMA